MYEVCKQTIRARDLRTRYWKVYALFAMSHCNGTQHHGPIMKQRLADHKARAEDVGGEIVCQAF